uniref:U1 small nuclear ribonucleoprotein C n=1 Tax=Strigamia maritima TaxID=126957 RepID=T1J6A1_STRMM
MPKYYCDYCDTYLTHDSPSVRKTHCSGRKHLDNVKFYYQKWSDDQIQANINAIVAAQKAGTLLPRQFPGTWPCGPPPSMPPMGFRPPPPVMFPFNGCPPPHMNPMAMGNMQPPMPQNMHLFRPLTNMPSYPPGPNMYTGPPMRYPMHIDPSTIPIPGPVGK